MVVGPSRGPKTIDPKYTVIIGTSGSADYLNDTASDRRLWPLSVPSARPSLEDGEDSDGCDGLHDESAPTQYLCSRCFPGRYPLRGDLSDPQDDASAEPHRDAYDETE